MVDTSFEQPAQCSSCRYPRKRWELDESGQPANPLIEQRRTVQLISLTKIGRVPVLKARMNADLHMSEDLKNTGKGNLFVIFGEPDIDLLEATVQVRINGVDVFHPNNGEIRSDGPDGIACWFIDTDYNEESFFVRQAYFLGANDPYSALKTTLKAEINEEAWSTLHSAVSRPFAKPASGRIAVKVINHLGDEVMKVFRVM
jgi:adenine-specific DNA-methyltransferase